MKEMTEEKRIEEALSSTEKYLSIKRLQDLIELHNGNTYSKKFLSLKLNSELETWKSKKSKVYAEKITATLYLNQNPLFVASGVYNREDNYFSPE